MNGNSTRTTIDRIHVSAASSLQFVLPEIGEEYKSTSGSEVTFSFAASGSIASQIKRGAPIDLFCSADSRFVKDLEFGGHTWPGKAAIYAFGKLVMAVTTKSPPSNLEELTSPSFERIGLANPDLAPYGRAAKQALTEIGAWDEVSRKAVFGENVAHVLAYLRRANMDCAFLPLSLARREQFVFIEVQEDLYDPIEHVLTVPMSAENGAGGTKFAEFILSSRGQAILRQHGFGTPERQD
jgi:molybdate transport system substrate-binding protein